MESTSSTDATQELRSKFAQMEEMFSALSGAMTQVRSVIMNQSPGATVSSTPVDIFQLPTNMPGCRSTATCKPPKEPSFTGDQQQEWEEFEEEFLRYFRIAQGEYLRPEVQVDLLLATAGEKVRRVFKQLTLSTEDAKNLSKVLPAIRQVFCQQQSKVVNKYLFMKIRREPGEGLENFIARLERSARRCSFVDEEERVLEQLIYSTIDNVEILKRMVKDSPPTLSEVIRILRTDEVATQELDRMVGKPGQVSVNAVSGTRSKEAPNRNSNAKISSPALRKGGNCSNCIFNHDTKDQCPAKEMECFFCKKLGHMIAKCRKRAAANQGNNQAATGHNRAKNQTQRRSVYEVQQIEDSGESDAESVAIDSVFIGSLSGADKSSWQTAIRIGNKLVNCKIDTGAEVNVMPKRVYQQLREKPSLSPSKIILRTVAGQVKPLGVISVPVQFKATKSQAKFFIVDDNTPTLCGLQTSVELGLVQKLFL